MSEMPKDVTNAFNFDNLDNLAGSSTSSMEKVAVSKIAARCHEMSTLIKVMGGHNTAFSTHSVSEMRQINMAGNI